MSKKDYYDVLSVPRNSDADALKKAFRRLAMKYHPDRNPNDKKAEENFKEVKEAYEVLSDPQKRQIYDQYGHAGMQQGAGGFSSGGGAGGLGDIFEDIFGDMFGVGRGGARGGRGQRSSGPIPERGADLRYNLELSLEDAVFGKQININVPTYVGCDLCSGSGVKKGSQPVSCTTCNGIGQLHMQQGFFTVQQTCHVCHGAGQVIKDRCGQCSGYGRVKQTKNLSVKIPPGVDTGDRVRLTQEGEAGLHGGPAGDLYVQVTIAKHDLFERDGENLACDVPIRLTTAALGGEIDVPTLQGRVKLKVPPETQTGKIFRLREKGAPKVNSKHVGDLLCRIVVETPVGLSNEQKDLLVQLEKTMHQSKDKNSPDSESWLQKVKKFIDHISQK